MCDMLWPNARSCSRFGADDLDVVWQQTARHWGAKLDKLKQAAADSKVIGNSIELVGCSFFTLVFLPPTQVAFLLACHCSTSKVEQSFSFLEMFSSGRKGRTLESNLRRDREFFCIHRVSHQNV